MRKKKYKFKNTVKCQNPLVEDLENIAYQVYSKDVTTKGISRILGINVEVSNVDIWNQQIPILKKLIKFMSHDDVHLTFTPKNIKLEHQQLSFISNDYDTVTLLSGGLDSLCGVDYNIKNNIKSVYCSYELNSFEVSSLKYICSYLKDNYSTNHYIFNKKTPKKEVHTQRTRSLYFLALACSCADSYGIDTVSLYENGIMSLNPGLKSRVPTRTTHPYTIKLFNDLLINLNINIKVLHPFLFKTKGELINNLSPEFKNLVKHTNTCGMSRQNINLEIKTGHCGSCVPCLLRKISLAAYDNETLDAEYDLIYNIKEIYHKPLFKDFLSSYSYYKDFYDKIVDKSILLELDLRKNYYEDGEYIDKTYSMLQKFKNELEYFFSKYPM